MALLTRGRLLFLFGLLSSSVANGQTGQDHVLTRAERKVVAPSPEASQLGTFGNVAPNLNTGAVQYSIPLPPAKGRQLSLPVSLDYHYTGLQVNELPSWVGLGWTATCGGVITRTICGLPDETPDVGYLNDGMSPAHVGEVRKKPNGVIVVEPQTRTPLLTECEVLKCVKMYFI